jgi:glucarate dehydratase
MYCVSFADLPRTIELGSVSIILGDHHLWGGLRASVELARICRTWNIGLSMHSNSHMGISLAAMTHLAAARSRSARADARAISGSRHPAPR